MQKKFNVIFVIDQYCKMSYPTGMGANTGNHFNDVAGRMRGYLNGPDHHHHPSPFHSPPFPHPPHNFPFHGPFPMPPLVGPMFRPIGPRHNPFNPSMEEDFGGFARLFVRDLLS